MRFIVASWLTLTLTEPLNPADLPATDSNDEEDAPPPRHVVVVDKLPLQNVEVRVLQILLACGSSDLASFLSRCSIPLSFNFSLPFARLFLLFHFLCNYLSLIYNTPVPISLY